MSAHTPGQWKGLDHNARLTAVAPELLAAARLAEAVLARGKWFDKSSDPEAVALRALRAAIANAVAP